MEKISTAVTTNEEEHVKGNLQTAEGTKCECTWKEVQYCKNGLNKNINRNVRHRLVLRCDIWGILKGGEMPTPTPTSS